MTGCVILEKLEENVKINWLNIAWNSLLSSFVSSRTRVAENHLVGRRAIQSQVQRDQYVLR